MTHPEYDQLISLAFGETDDAAAGHLTGCDPCRAELATLRQVAAVGAETQPLHDLPTPPARIWDGIHAAVTTTATPDAPAGQAGPIDLAAERAARTRTGDPARTRDPGAAAPIDLAAERTRRRWPRWATAAAASIAAVAVALAVALTIARPRDQILATAALTAYGTTPPAAHGDAEVLADGQLRLHAADLPPIPGYYQVWLIDPTTLDMFPLGVLGRDTTAQLPLPTDIDLATYSLIDVSAEQYDNNPAHSGDSLLRGELT